MRLFFDLVLYNTPLLHAWRWWEHTCFFFHGKGIASLVGIQNTLSTFYDRGRRLNHTPIFHDGTVSWDTHLYLLFSGFSKPRGALGCVLDLAALAQPQVAACFTTWADCATSFVMRAALLLAQVTLPFSLSARPRNLLPMNCAYIGSSWMLLLAFDSWRACPCSPQHSLLGSAANGLFDS